jgi:hypothetical protein
MHFSAASFDGAIIASDGASTFCLRRGGQYGEEVAALNFSKKSSANKRTTPPRHLRLNLFKPGGLPSVFASRPPRINAIGEWTLDFGDRPVIASVKNALLVDPNNKEACAIMKADDQTLRIDALEAFDPLIVFTLGIGSWLCALP